MPGYGRRSDIVAHALTLQLPLEGKLLRGGVTGVIKTKHDQWIHCQQHGSMPDFFISTREVCSHQITGLHSSAWWTLLFAFKEP